jgi:hypothetical protein
VRFSSEANFDDARLVLYEKPHRFASKVPRFRELSNPVMWFERRIVSSRQRFASRRRSIVFFVDETNRSTREQPFDAKAVRTLSASRARGHGSVRRRLHLM